MRFNHINVPDQWRNYWTKYPNGYTILESLMDWIAQVDNMVDNQNKLNKTVEDYRVELDVFIERFGPNLQTEVTNILSEWQISGFLDVVISEALQTEIDTVKTQLSEIAVDVKIFGVTGDGVTDDTVKMQEAFDFAISNNKRLLLGDKTYVITDTLTITIPPNSSFEIIGKPNNKTQFLGKINTDKPLLYIKSSAPGTVTSANLIENIRIRPFDNSYNFKFTSFKIEDTIGCLFTGLYAHNCKTGFLLTDSIDGYIELNTFERCNASTCDYNWRFEGAESNSSFHGNKFIKCGFTAKNMEIAKGYSRDFLQYGLYFEKGFIYNCNFEFSAFMENGGCLIYINANGGYNFASITYENFKSPNALISDATPKSKIITGNNPSAILRLKGDIIGIGSNANSFDFSMYELATGGNERLSITSLSRTFNALGTDHYGKRNVIYTYGHTNFEEQIKGAKTGIYRYHNEADITNEAGLILASRGTEGRVIFGEVKNGKPPEDMVKGFEIFVDGSVIKSTKGAKLYFGEKVMKYGLGEGYSIPNVVQKANTPGYANTTPDFVGQIWIDTSTKISYIATGDTSSDWKQITN